MAFLTVRRRWWFAALVVLSVGLGAFVLLRVPRVAAVRVVRRDVVQTVVASGRVHVAGDVELAVKSPGRVTAVAVKEGDHVNEGQLLISLDDAEARGAMAEAQASVARSLAELRRVRQKAAPLAQVSLRRAEVDVEYAQQELTRAQQLSAAGAFTAQQLEQAAQSVTLARTRRDTAQVELSNTMPAGADRDLAQASMQQAQAALDLAQTRLADAQIVAPAAGVVVDVAVDVGDSVQPGRALVRLVIDGPVQLEMEPDERNLALLSLGQPARASAEAFASQAFAARVSYIAPNVDPDRGTVKVRLDVMEPPEYLRADMTVSIEVEVAHANKALVVPTNLVRDLAGKQPWVLALVAGRGERRDVVVGVRDEETLQVVSGLDEGALVLADPELAVGVRVRANEQAR